MATLYENYLASNDFITYDTAGYYGAQEFTVGSASLDTFYALSSIEVHIKKVGSPGTVYLQAYRISDSDTEPDEAKIFATATVSDSAISTVGTWVNFQFDEASMDTMYPGTKYGFILNAPSHNTSNYIRWSREGTGTYSGGTNWLKLGAIGWMDVGPIDACFKIYGRPTTGTYLYENYQTGDDAGYYIWDDTYHGQTVVIGDASIDAIHVVHSISIRARRYGTVGTCYAKFYRLTDDRLPDVSVDPVLSTSFSGDDFSTSIGWETITFATKEGLHAGESYALVISAPNGTGTSNSLSWRADQSGSTYSGPALSHISDASGWASVDGRGMMFAIYGHSPGWESGWEGTGVRDDSRWDSETDSGSLTICTNSASVFDGSQVLKVDGTSRHYVSETASLDSYNIAGCRFALNVHSSISSIAYPIQFRESDGGSNMIALRVLSTGNWIAWYFDGGWNSIGSEFAADYDKWYQVEFKYDYETPSVHWRVWNASGDTLEHSEQTRTVSVSTGTVGKVNAGLVIGPASNATWYLDKLAVTEGGYPNPHYTFNESSSSSSSCSSSSCSSSCSSQESVSSSSSSSSSLSSSSSSHSSAVFESEWDDPMYGPPVMDSYRWDEEYWENSNEGLSRTTYGPNIFQGTGALYYYGDWLHYVRERTQISGDVPNGIGVRFALRINTEPSAGYIRIFQIYHYTAIRDDIFYMQIDKNLGAITAYVRRPSNSSFVSLPALLYYDTQTWYQVEVLYKWESIGDYCSWRIWDASGNTLLMTEGGRDSLYNYEVKEIRIGAVQNPYYTWGFSIDSLAVADGEYPGPIVSTSSSSSSSSESFSSSSSESFESYSSSSSSWSSSSSSESVSSVSSSSSSCSSCCSSSFSSSSSSFSFSSSSSSSFSSSSSSSNQDYLLWSDVIMQRHGVKPNILVELTYDNSGNKKFYSTRAVYASPASMDYYQPKVLSVGTVTHKVENWEGGMDLSTMNIDIVNVGKGEADSDWQTFKKNTRILNRNVEVKVHLDGTPLSEAYTIMKGKVTGDKDKLGKWTLQVADSRKRYTKNIPPKPYTVKDYPNLQEGSEGNIIPYLFGYKEKVPCTQIDTENRKFKVSGIPLYSLGSVYDVSEDKDGKKVYSTLQVVSSDTASAEFSIQKMAFTIRETDSPGLHYFYITDSKIASYGDPPATNQIEGWDLTNQRNLTVGAIVSRINEELAGMTASLICSSDVPATRLKPVIDQNIHLASYEVELRIPEAGTIVCDATGAKDVSNGKFTGNTNGPIHMPGDLIYYILGSLCGLPDTEIDLTSITNARTTWEGYKFGTLLSNSQSAFAVCQDIAQQAYMWCYWDSSNNKLTLASADINLSEATDELYYEDGVYPRILANSLTKESAERDIYNKIDVYYGYDLVTGNYEGYLYTEDTVSQSEDEGYGVVNNYKIDSDWIPQDFEALRIEYVGTGQASLEITGEGLDGDEVRLKTHVWDGSSATEFNFDLTSTSYNTLTKVANAINSDSDYSASVMDGVCGSLDSRGLRDVTDQNLLIFRKLAEYGELGQSEGGFMIPNDLEAYGNYIFVADTYNHRVVRIDADPLGANWIEFGGYGAGDNSLKYPGGVTTDGTYVYVTDRQNHRIVRLTMGLVFSSHEGYEESYDTESGIGDWSASTTDGYFSMPSGITNDGTYLYISDSYNHRIQKFAISTFSHNATYGSYGTGNTNVIYPGDIANEGSNLYIVDCQTNNRLLKWTTSGAYVDSITGLRAIGAVATDGTNLWVGNNERSGFGLGNQIRKYKTDLSFIDVSYESFCLGLSASGDSSSDYLWGCGTETGGHNVVKFRKGSHYRPTYSFAKVTAIKNILQKKASHDKIIFDTSLFGLDQEMAKPIEVRRIDETENTRVRVLQVTRKPNEKKVTIVGREEGPVESQYEYSSTAAYTPTVAVGGMVGYWDMSQATSAYATDSSESGYTLASVGTPLQLGDGIIYYGANEYHWGSNDSVPYLDFKNNDHFTVICKYKNLSTFGHPFAMVSKWGTASVDWQYALVDDYDTGLPGGVVKFKIYDRSVNASYEAVTPYPYGYDAFMSSPYMTVTGVWNGIDLRLYTNGVLSESANNPYTPPIGTTINASGDANFEIGRFAEALYCYGYIDYVKVYSYALGPDEVMREYTYGGD